MAVDNYPFDNVVAALRLAAYYTSEGVVAYTPGEINEPSATLNLTYKELLQQAEANAAVLLKTLPLKQESVVLVHFDTALDSIIWFWSVLLTGIATPTVTSPGMFSPNPSDRQKHLKHLNTTLGSPLCLTRRKLKEPFGEVPQEDRISLYPIEDLQSEAGSNGITTATQNGTSNGHSNGNNKAVTNGSPTASHVLPSDVAVLMLTSGSSGNAKVVPLTHSQLLTAFRGKKQSANLNHPKNPFLSWVNMDHVANLVHCHLFAIVEGISQIQVPSSDILVSPMQLLNLISRHRVSRTFVPNFLFAKLRRQLEGSKNSSVGLDADLNLETVFLDTGGEANVTEVCIAMQSLLSAYGAPDDVFKPSFGMTETCAGCIFNMNCPSREVASGAEFASLGECMPGIQMRVTLLDGSGIVAKPGETGNLELTGEAVFKGYYNNDAANAESFTVDGWFRTGDLAYLNESGHLHLAGRSKELININGVKYHPHELEWALEEAEIQGATASYFCCFSTRDATMDTEAVVVLYLPSYDETDDEARYKTQSAIIKVAGVHTHSRPRVVPLRAEDMPKSTLGKLSRAKLRASLVAGRFDAHVVANNDAIKRFRLKTRSKPETQEEITILAIARDQLDVEGEDEDDEFSVTDSILAAGATSMDLVAIMHRINRELQPIKPVRLTDLLNHPTTRDLANHLAATASGPHVYDPVVTLQPHGDKNPLWLVHPGVGEVLVFVNMAHRLTDRPVYAFRAKGFNAAEGETPFESLEELFQIYHAAIKARQPKGPYAIAGYSFGGMVAFEVTKLLEAEGEEVRYCGSWNLPPHIKFRMRELLWDECVIHLFYFVGLMDEAAAYVHKPALCEFNKQGKRLEAIRYLRQHCDADRWDELGLSEEYYLLWVGLASNMQGMAIDYEPSGSVQNMVSHIREVLQFLLIT